MAIFLQPFVIDFRDIDISNRGSESVDKDLEGIRKIWIVTAGNVRLQGHLNEGKKGDESEEQDHEGP